MHKNLHSKNNKIMDLFYNAVTFHCVQLSSMLSILMPNNLCCEIKTRKKDTGSFFLARKNYLPTIPNILSQLQKYDENENGYNFAMSTEKK